MHKIYSVKQGDVTLLSYRRSEGNRKKRTNYMQQDFYFIRWCTFCVFAPVTYVRSSAEKPVLWAVMIVSCGTGVTVSLDRILAQTHVFFSLSFGIQKIGYLILHDSWNTLLFPWIVSLLKGIGYHKMKFPSPFTHPHAV